uniref:Uncharacterized protein n=1 Tax=Triticum urartu TaxID=4572 RepID=A0A8R7QLP8_TRIUA
MARLPSHDSPERKRRRLRFSCSVHAVAGEAKKSSRNNCSTTGGTVNECIGWCPPPPPPLPLFVLLLLEQCMQCWC